MWLLLSLQSVFAQTHVHASPPPPPSPTSQVFYSLLVSKAALAGFVPLAASFVAILVGLVATLIVLSVVQQALPALPFSLFLGVAVFMTANYTAQGYAAELSNHGAWV